MEMRPGGGRDYAEIMLEETCPGIESVQHGTNERSGKWEQTDAICDEQVTCKNCSVSRRPGYASSQVMGWLP